MAAQADVQLVCVYIFEAHPKNGWSIYRHCADVEQPVSLEQRSALAKKTFELSKRTGQFVEAVDDLDNRAMHLFSAFPERLYVLDEQGKVLYKGGVGPHHYDCDELEEFLS